jgi:hypothetical protein
VDERPQRGHQARGARLRANARGCDGCVRKELAQKLKLRGNRAALTEEIEPGCAALANRPFGDSVLYERPHLGDNPMADTERQMPEHVGAAYKDAADNIRFLQRQQWLGTNYALLVYVAIFVISAHYFSRTDFARNLLGLLTIATFGVHWYMMNLFERAITKFRNRLGWIYKTYFSGEERIGLGLELEPRHQPEVFISLLAVSLIGAVLTAIYLWAVR